MKETLPKSIQELILSLREKLKDEPEIVDMLNDATPIPSTQP